ncbi:hypothetical protein T03_7121 [Trichinella britovi]|uniref:Uncharacterized protein n=2 Tax=Trichinella TaxID=6333 RepID=A0A0V1D067_TRIBR|nr:hypothetical protein T03_7121 [Trichinella britovi]
MFYAALTTITHSSSASRNCHCTKAAKIYLCQQPPLLMLSKLRFISIDGSVIDYFKKENSLSLQLSLILNEQLKRCMRTHRTIETSNQL